MYYLPKSILLPPWLDITSKASEILSSLELKGIVLWNSEDGNKITEPTFGWITFFGIFR